MFHAWTIWGRSDCKITFDGVDVEKDLSDDDTRVDEHHWTQERLDLVAAQEFHKSPSPSAHKMPKISYENKKMHWKTARKIDYRRLILLYLQAATP